MARKLELEHQLGKKAQVHPQRNIIWNSIWERSHQYSTMEQELEPKMARKLELEHQLGKKPQVHSQRNIIWNSNWERSHQYIHNGTRIGTQDGKEARIGTPAGKDATSTSTKETRFGTPAWEARHQYIHKRNKIWLSDGYLIVSIPDLCTLTYLGTPAVKQDISTSTKEQDWKHQLRKKEDISTSTKEQDWKHQLRKKEDISTSTMEQ